ncbi:hypothetical protein [Billgrantia antri]|uniref:hypothetical protein n=1 Tax=Billgrantia antri TaxID=2846777 RepID=UPI003B22822A
MNHMEQIPEQKDAYYGEGGIRVPVANGGRGMTEFKLLFEFAGAAGLESSGIII